MYPPYNQEKDFTAGHPSEELRQILKETPKHCVRTSAKTSDPTLNFLCLNLNSHSKSEQSHTDKSVYLPVREQKQSLHFLVFHSWVINHSPTGHFKSELYLSHIDNHFISFPQHSVLYRYNTLLCFNQSHCLPSGSHKDCSQHVLGFGDCYSLFQPGEQPVHLVVSMLFQKLVKFVIFKSDQLLFHSFSVSLSLNHYEFNKASTTNLTQDIQQKDQLFYCDKKNVDQINSLIYYLQKTLKFNIIRFIIGIIGV